MRSFDLKDSMMMAIKRRITYVFITRLGFIRFSFQRNPRFKRGNKVVLLDGIPPPMIFGPTGGGEAGTHRMKGAVVVAGIKKTDVDAVIEIDVCKKKDFQDALAKLPHALSSEDVLK